eukprot:GHUV01045215.1.p1 GENE.GHUV01045215.1~~GHUV01045215.1.p1  ORF type:complete len:129 (-),score=17.97 GHUV01045215.1:211-597(-)
MINQSVPMHSAAHKLVLRCCTTPLCCRLLTPDEAQVLMRSKNRPLLVLSAMGQLLAVSNMRIESKTHMDESVRVLQEALGSCEKILTTPIPISYTRWDLEMVCRLQAAMIALVQGGTWRSCADCRLLL